jgi:hypothetical protein
MIRKTDFSVRVGFTRTVASPGPRGSPSQMLLIPLRPAKLLMERKGQHGSSPTLNLNMVD